MYTVIMCRNDYKQLYIESIQCYDPSIAFIGFHYKFLEGLIAVPDLFYVKVSRLECMCVEGIISHLTSPLSM